MLLTIIAEYLFRELENQNAFHQDKMNQTEQAIFKGLLNLLVHGILLANILLKGVISL